MSQEQYTLQDVCNAIGDLGQTLDKKDKADGTNWTVADETVQKLRDKAG